MAAASVHTMEGTGRVVVPASIRTRFGLGVGSPLAFFIDEEDRRIILMPLASACIFCGVGETLVYFSGKPVCSGCRGRLARRAARRSEVGQEHPLGA